MSDKQIRTDLHFLRVAFLTALDRSKDPSTKVGAIIVAPDGRKMSGGYNGFVAGAPEEEDSWINRPKKYPRVIHAELNALLNCPFEKAGCTVYCSLHPCTECLKALIQSGITRIVYYGVPNERWAIDDAVFAELAPMVEWQNYSDDPIIEGLRILYS